MNARDPVEKVSLRQISLCPITLLAAWNDVSSNIVALVVDSINAVVIDCAEEMLLQFLGCIIFTRLRMGAAVVAVFRDYLLELVFRQLKGYPSLLRIGDVTVQDLVSVRLSSCFASYRIDRHFSVPVTAATLDQIPINAPFLKYPFCPALASAQDSMN
jgi:hypothetical protein